MSTVSRCARIANQAFPFTYSMNRENILNQENALLSFAQDEQILQNTPQEVQNDWDLDDLQLPLLVEEDNNHHFSSWCINPIDIKQDPLPLLLQFSEKLLTHRAWLSIEYRGSLGQDQGGLIRDFVTLLFQSLFSLSLLPTARSNKGSIPTLSNDQKEESIKQWKAIGSIFARALDPQGHPICVGKHFHPVVFSILYTLAEEEIHEIPETMNPISERTWNKALKTYLNNMYIGPIFENVEEVRAFVEEAQLSKKQKLTGVSSPKEFLESCDIPNRIVAILSIAKSMQRYGVQRFLLRPSPSLWQEAIEGIFFRQALQEALAFPDALSSAQATTIDYLVQWIQNASVEDLSLWVQAATGSSTLISGRRIQIAFEGSLPNLHPTYHTCGMEVHISGRYDSFDKLKERFEESIKAVQSSENRFDML